MILFTTIYSLAQTQINPIEIGRSNTGDSPACYVDGIVGTGHTPNIAACIAYLNSLLVTGAGTIYSTIPEDITSQIFYPASFPAFSGTIFLNNDIGTSSDCAQTGTLNCWVTEVPLILPPRLSIRGVGAAATGMGIKTNSGTAITFGTTFPLPIGFSGTVTTPTCAMLGGSLSDGTYNLEATLVNNLMGGSSAPLTPGRGSASTEKPVLCNNHTGTQEISWTINSAPPVGTGFGAQEIVAYITAANGASGTELEAGTAAIPVVCTGSMGVAAGTVDADGGSCRLPTVGGTVTFAIKVAPTTGPPPPLVDVSNPMIVEGSGPDTGNANAVDLRDLTLFGSPTGVTTPLSNEPAVAVLGYTAQEQSGTSQVACYGAFTSACIYSGLNSNNSHHVGFNAGSSQGPSTGNFYSMILDGRMLSGGTARYVADGTMAAHCGGPCGGGVTNPAQILITGAKAFPNLSGVHTESAGGFGIQVTNGASANIAGYDGFATGVNHAVLQIDGAGSPSGGAAGRVQATVHDDTGNAKLLVEDDTIPSGTGNCSAQTGGTNTAYCYTGSGYETAVYDNGLRQSPNIRTAQINDLLQGLPVLELSGVGSAVDFFTATNSATGTSPTISLAASGSDTNVNINLIPLGTGVVKCNGLPCLGVSGTINSGGIPYFSSTAQESSSALLALNHVLLGGGTGAAPSSDANLSDVSNTLTYTGAGGISAPILTSTVSTGAPLTVSSQTTVTNLSAGFLAGASWPSPSAIGSTTPNTGAFTTLSVSTSMKIANLVISATAPTISSGFGSLHSIGHSNGTAVFTIGVGGSPANTGVLAMPSAANGWYCTRNR